MATVYAEEGSGGRGERLLCTSCYEFCLVVGWGFAFTVIGGNHGTVVLYTFKETRRFFFIRI